MKKIFLIIISLTIVHIAGVAQIAINATGAQPTASAMLDVSSANKGVLIPRMTTTQRNAIASPAKGLLVYDSTSALFWFYNGAKWASLSTAAAGWSLTGNNNTNPSVNFLGTTDNKPLVFKVNNTEAGYLDTLLNTAWGAGALAKNTTGYSNIAVGAGALHSDSTGGSNLVAVGDSAMYNNSEYAVGVQTYNTAIGSKALYSNTTGAANTAIGFQSLFANTNGYYNTAIGSGTLHSNTTGGSNSAIGYHALYKNTTGGENTASGSEALFGNTTGNYNTAIGTQSLYNNSSGGANTATGSSALEYNTTGSSNTATGVSALYYNSTGGYNTATGADALNNNTTGSANTATGVSALFYNSTGSYNTATGGNALNSNTTGNNNAAHGFQSLYANTTGYDNTAVGYKALAGNTTGNFNTAVGFGALASTTTAYYNTAIGYNAGTAHDNGYNNVFLGANTDVNQDGLYNVIAIGQSTLCTASSQVRIGNYATTSIGGYANWSNISDGRVKRNIQQNVPGLAFINKLTPVTYNLDLDAADRIIQRPQPKDKDGKAVPVTQLERNARKAKEQIVYTGFVAQDVEKAAKEVNYDFSGVDKPKNDKDLYSLRYADFIAPLVKAVQELSKDNDAIQKENTNMEARLQKIEADLKIHN